MRKLTKGQIISTDFMVSIVLFIFIIQISTLIWNNLNSQIQQNEENNDFQSSITSLSSNLIESSGVPANWEEETDISKISQIGLSIDSNLLSLEKIIAFTKLPYDKGRLILGVETKNVYIEFTDGDGTILKDDSKELTFGLFPGNVGSVYKISRLVVIKADSKNIIGFVKILMW